MPVTGYQLPVAGYRLNKKGIGSFEVILLRCSNSFFLFYLTYCQLKLRFDPSVPLRTLRVY
jgi:hypothetical protein